MRKYLLFLLIFFFSTILMAQSEKEKYKVVYGDEVYTFTVEKDGIHFTTYTIGVKGLFKGSGPIPLFDQEVKSIYNKNDILIVKMTSGNRYHWQIIPGHGLRPLFPE